MSHDTVETLIANGEIVPRGRVTIDDLSLAAVWCRAYEGDPDDDRDNLTALASVADYLDREINRRTKRI